VSALKICPQCGTEYELDQRFCPKDGSTLKMQGATTDLVGSIINKSYHVLRKLGEGGMGTVYLAEHVKMGRKSAVKVMNPGTVNDADAISRFNREAANASKISHPNVAAVYDFGETEDGMIFLAMEYVEGPALTWSRNWAPCRRREPGTSRARWRTRSASRTTWASSIAISSRTTSCWRRIATARTA
jgi:eukaryotic-like serine/threonine-protein kinase